MSERLVILGLGMGFGLLLASMLAAIEGGAYGLASLCGVVWALGTGALLFHICHGRKGKQAETYTCREGR